MKETILEFIADFLSWMTVGYGTYLVLYSTFLFVAVEGVIVATKV